MYQSDLSHSSKALQEKLHALYALKGAGGSIELGFRPAYLHLLDALGNPHTRLPPVVHVAGTNGKGSTIAMMRSVLESAGYRVHVYTSPHLMRFNERIVLAGQEVDNKALEALVDRVLKVNDGREVTFFEVTTAMAFTAFAQTSADVVLLETGLGGRLDCTNVIEAPAVNVITSIGYDHQEFLGQSIVDITREKAGIMKMGAPCVVSVQRSNPEEVDILSVLEQCAEEHQAILYRSDDVILPAVPSLIGDHQTENAKTACAALRVLSRACGLVLSDVHIRQGLQNVSWPARMQNVSKIDPNMHQKGWRVFLDGGHNKDAAQAMAKQMQAWRGEYDAPIYLVVGMMGHKDASGFLMPLLPYCDGVYVVPIADEPNAMDPNALVRIIDSFKEFSNMVVVSNDWKSALSSISLDNDTACTVLIAGSLYLAGDVLKAFQE